MQEREINAYLLQNENILQKWPIHDEEMRKISVAIFQSALVSKWDFPYTILLDLLNFLGKKFEFTSFRNLFFLMASKDFVDFLRAILGSRYFHK